MADKQRPGRAVKIYNNQGLVLDERIKGRGLREVRDMAVAKLPSGTLITKITVDGIEYGKLLKSLKVGRGRPKGSRNKFKPSTAPMPFQLEVSTIRLLREKIPNGYYSEFVNRVILEALNPEPSKEILLDR